MTDRPLIVLSLEGLATAALGCYGSSWNQTPAIDSIASGGCVWDRVVASHDDPQIILDDLFAEGADDWSSGWRNRGAVELITDVQAIGQSASCFDCVTTLNLDSAGEQDRPAFDIEGTRLASLIAAATDRDFQDEPWSLLWLHSNFLTQCWDAPRDLFPIDQAEMDRDEPSEEVEWLGHSEELTDGDDPLPLIFDTIAVPQFQLTDQSHPDLVSSWMRTYGCQIRLVDWMIEVLLQSLRTEDPRVAIVGMSGFGLGQNGWFGHRQGPVRSCHIRVPLILSDAGPVRIPQLTPHSSLPGILDELGNATFSFASPQAWVKTSPPDLRIETESDRADHAVTTPNWFFVRDLDRTEHLFLKPDDIEDFNDVGRLRGDVVDLLGEDKK